MLPGRGYAGGGQVEGVRWKVEEEESRVEEGRAVTGERRKRN